MSALPKTASRSLGTGHLIPLLAQSLACAQAPRHALIGAAKTPRLRQYSARSASFSAAVASTEGRKVGLIKGRIACDLIGHPVVNLKVAGLNRLRREGVPRPLLGDQCRLERLAPVNPPRLDRTGAPEPIDANLAPGLG